MNPGDFVMAEWGANEAATRRDVAALVSAHPMGEALAEMAFTLARSLDSGPEMMRAAVARELRATLAELAGMGVSDDDDLEDRLSAPVRDSEDPGEV